MSRITRRAFLRHIAYIGGSTTLAACSWTNPAVSSGFGQTALSIWSMPSSIDTALARWRRRNPAVEVRRQIVDHVTLTAQIQQLNTGTSDVPDIVIADAYTFYSAAPLEMWRHDENTQSNQFVPAAVAQTQTSSNRAFAYPLTVNPLKLWYQSEIIFDTVQIDDTRELQSALGDSWRTFAQFIRLLHRNNPLITTISSCFDDVSYPIYLHALNAQLPISDAIFQSYALAREHVIGRMVHFSGDWFDRIKRNTVALAVGGRWMGQAIQRTQSTETPSPWRTIAHPFGPLFGPGIIAAIPIQSPRYEQALRLLADFYGDAEYQVLISNESGSIPALNAAYDHPDLQNVDFVNPTVQISTAWDMRNETITTQLSADRIRELQQLKQVFYAWQQGTLDDIALERSIIQIFTDRQDQ